MNLHEFISTVGHWEDCRFGTIGPIDDARPQQSVLIELLPSPNGGYCSGCGTRVSSVHETTERWIRDLPILNWRTELLVHRRRLLCSECGPQLEHLSWLEPYARWTNRLAEAVARLCNVASLSRVAEHYGLGWETVKEIHKRYLLRTLPRPDFSQVTMLAMDEFAVRKGHRYATVILEPTRKRVLWVGPGRGREAVRAFFEQLSPAERERIQAVVMDMNGAYEEEVRAQCPNAEIVFDLFHVVAKYGREVLDRVRVDEANRLKDDKPARKVIKGSKWLLLGNRENLKTHEQRVRLEELLEANEALFTAYVLKDDLKLLWRAATPEAARELWQSWRERAVSSGIAVLKRFAEKLAGYVNGIVAHARWRLHTSVLEGINNTIKVMKRMAYGFRDQDYFFLRIEAAFPGDP